MDREARAQDDIAKLSRQGLNWVTFATEATEAISKVVQFDRCCWHSVDPGTVLFSGSLIRNVGCSGSWLAEHEYVIDDVNKWWFLARSGRLAGATSLATHGDLSRSARNRSHAAYGIGDELRGSFVADDRYWAQPASCVTATSRGSPTATSSSWSRCPGPSPRVSARHWSRTS